MSKDCSAVAVYTHIDQAEEAVSKLGEGGFPLTQVSILSSDIKSEKKIHGFVTSCDVAKAAAGTGAWVGGIFGLLTGAAFIFVPGVGPVIAAGTFATAMLGGVEGAVVGAAVAGTFGWLSALGIDKAHILKYEESIKTGKFIVIAHGTAEQADKAKHILGGTAPAQLDSYAAA
jgi:hypothetical protein